MAIAVELVNLSKKFGSHKAVRRLYLQVPTGCFYAFLGTNGAGKTTTLLLMCGLMAPDEGDVLIDGKSITRQPEAAKQELAYVPDEPSLYDKLTPLEFLEFNAGLWGVSPSRIVTYGQELLERLGLWDRRNESTEAFPRGIKQRLALAGALIHEPKVMLLDEPLTGIDAAYAREVKNMLREYVDRGNTVIMTTHIMEMAERLADRIGIIREGCLLAEGSLEELRLQAQQPHCSLEDVFIALTQA